MKNLWFVSNYLFLYICTVDDKANICGWISSKENIFPFPSANKAAKLGILTNYVNKPVNLVSVSANIYRIFP